MGHQAVKAAAAAVLRLSLCSATAGAAGCPVTELETKRKVSPLCRGHPGTSARRGHCPDPQRIVPRGHITPGTQPQFQTSTWVAIALFAIASALFWFSFMLWAMRLSGNRIGYVLGSCFIIIRLLLLHC